MTTFILVEFKASIKSFILTIRKAKYILFKQTIMQLYQANNK